MYIWIGVVCMVIFLLGYLIVGDFMNLIYSLASIVPIYLGFKMKDFPYAIVSKTNIVVFGLYGEVRHEYNCVDEENIVLVDDKIFIQSKDKSVKIKMNKWFVNQGDWNTVLELFK